MYRSHPLTKKRASTTAIYAA